MADPHSATCPSCGTFALEDKGAYTFATQQTGFERYICGDCGTVWVPDPDRIPHRFRVKEDYDV